MRAREENGPYTWVCPDCQEGVLGCRAYPSILSQCPVCGAREAGFGAQEDTGRVDHVHVNEWPDGRGARAYCEGQGMSLSWGEWDAIVHRLVDAKGE